ncbi:MAG TPA: cobyric acid synthase [Methanomassiliicoccales archaeon]|nr:cobyric acid synthase [Methanomassiliicoccales archaeon]
MVHRIMVQGVTSGAGKTTLTAAICRHLSQKGVDVVPFKSQNVSLNSFVTDDGGEMAISQAYQAWASGVEPSSDMNPILVKPKGNGLCQIVLRGRPWKDLGPGDSTTEVIEELRQQVMRSFEEDILGHEVVVIEGMGSPVEMNLKDKDVSNMWLAKTTRSPVILVGDIEKGGVFAGIFGTYLLLNDEEKDLLKGFVINRFRGDSTILKNGIEELESRMGVPCLGVLPYVRFTAPQEDSMDLDRGTGPGSKENDVRERWMKDLDLLLQQWEGHLNWAGIEAIVHSSR